MKEATKVPTNPDLEKMGISLYKNQVDLVLTPLAGKYTNLYIKYLDTACINLKHLNRDSLYLLYILHCKDTPPRFDIETFSLLKNTIGSLFLFYPAKLHPEKLASFSTEILAFKLDATIDCAHDVWFLKTDGYMKSWWLLPYSENVYGNS